MDIEELIRESNHIEHVWDEAEVAQSLLAWDFLADEVEFLTEDIILKTHQIVLAFLDPEICGKYRNINVQVGFEVLPHWLRVPHLMELWVSSYSVKSPQGAHVDFEKIHPFADGNGRTGRLLMWWQELKSGRPFTEITYENRFDYYEWFRR